MVLPGGYNASLCSSHMGLMVDPGQLPSCNITALMREVPLYKRYNILELSPEQSRMCDLLNTTSSFQEFEKKLEIYEHTQDQRKGDGDPKPGRKLLSQSREGPRLEVSDRPAPGGLTTLDCKARGFSTRDIALEWLRNGEPRPQDTRQGAVLPSTDGTFETGAAIDIDPSPGDTYTCRVERPSLPGGLSKDWGTVGTTSNALLIGGVIGGVLTGAVLLGAAIAGGVAYLLYRRHRRRRRRQAAGEPTTP